MEKAIYEKGSDGNELKVVISTTSVSSRVKQLGRQCDIPDWLLTELLVRLPVKFVFTSKLVSKQWLSLISEPYFTRTYVSRASTRPLQQPWTFISRFMHVHDARSWGFREQDLLLSEEKEDVHDSSSREFKSPGYFLLPSPPFTTSDHMQETRFEVVGVSNGLVLCGSRLLNESCPRGFYRYVISNPVTGKWISLPPPTGHFEALHGGFVARVENDVLTDYRVVHIGWPSGPDVEFEVFLPEIGEWKEFSVTTDLEVGGYLWDTITLNGILHWMIGRNRIIAYDPFRNPDSLRFIALDAVKLKGNSEFYNGAPGLLDVHKGRLRYFEKCATFDNPQLYSGFGVWLLNDYSGGGDWCLQHRIKFSDILNGDILFEQRLSPISFHPFDSDILYCVFNDEFFLLNMKTKKCEDHRSFDAGDIIGQTRRVPITAPRLWSTFLFMFPHWPICIPVPSFES